MDKSIKKLELHVFIMIFYYTTTVKSWDPKYMYMYVTTLSPSGICWRMSQLSRHKLYSLSLNLTFKKIWHWWQHQFMSISQELSFFTKIVICLHPSIYLHSTPWNMFEMFTHCRKWKQNQLLADWHELVLPSMSDFFKC
jgi:hypothetical protein